MTFNTTYYCPKHGRMILFEGPGSAIPLDRDWKDDAEIVSCINCFYCSRFGTRPAKAKRTGES